MPHPTSVPYEDIVQNALRRVVHDVLVRVAKTGLPGNHHLYITFQTHFPGVKIPDYLKERHPDEVTIVIQYQFWDLTVEENTFYITLSFNNVQERLRIPYNAITGFVDPSVKFGLQFTPIDIAEEDLLPEEKEDKKDIKDSSKKTSKKSSSKESKVIALDAFRNKKS